MEQIELCLLHVYSDSDFILDGGHLCVSSPAEALKLQGVVAEAHGPASRCGAFLQLVLQVVKVREIMVPCGLGAGGAACALPAATGSAPLLAGWPQGPADVAAAALAAKVVCILHVEVAVFAHRAELATDIWLAETLPITLLALCDPTDGAPGLTLAAQAAVGVLWSQVPV